MPNFSYTAKSLDGKVKTGTSEAGDIKELAQSLKGEGLILVKADSEEVEKRSAEAKAKADSEEKEKEEGKKGKKGK